MKNIKRLFGFLLCLVMMVAVVPALSNTAFADDDYAFTVQPQSANIISGSAYITWDTNFTADYYVIYLNGSFVNYLADQKWCYADAATGTYTIRAYRSEYIGQSEPKCVESNEFTVTMVEPAFTVQPQSGKVADGEKLHVTWQTNFEPNFCVAYLNGNLYKDYQNTNAVMSSDDFDIVDGDLTIRAYYYVDGTEKYIESQKFTVTQKESEPVIVEPIVKEPENNNGGTVTINDDAVPLGALPTAKSNPDTGVAVETETDNNSNKPYAVMFVLLVSGAAFGAVIYKERKIHSK